jgi:cytochrome o ubiquinol oxidase subunit 3
MSAVSDSVYQSPGLTFDTEPHHLHDHASNAYTGFWIFMMSDLIIFGLFFATYGTMLTKPSMADGPGPKDILQLSGAAWETAALLLSTFTFGLASLAIKYDRSKRNVLFWMSVTLVLGVGFLALELNEFVTLFAAGHVPQRSGFLSGYFGLVPLHGLHVTVGVIWLIIMMLSITNTNGTITDLTKSRVARLALFWHFLDLIWVGIFSIVYLGGLA